MKNSIEEINSDINEAIQSIVDGMGDPLKLGRYLKALEKIAKVSYEKIESEIFSDAYKYTKDELAKMGITFNNGKRIFNFDHIEEWIALKSKMKELEEKAKKVSEMNVSELIDNNTGEILIGAVVTYSKQSITWK